MRLRLIEFEILPIVTYNLSALDEIFKSFKPEAVIHFAGLKAVGESVADPLLYYDVNVGGSISLLTAMSKAECKNSGR